MEDALRLAAAAAEIVRLGMRLDRVHAALDDGLAALGRTTAPAATGTAPSDPAAALADAERALAAAERELAGLREAEGDEARLADEWGRRLVLAINAGRDHLAHAAVERHDHHRALAAQHRAQAALLDAALGVYRSTLAELRGRAGPGAGPAA